MQRREYLVAAGTVATASMGGIGQAPKASAQDSQFELVEVEAPTEVGVMDPFTYSYTVANAGDEDATFWTYFTLDAWGESEVISERHALEIPAGEEETVENNTAHSPYIGTLRYTIHEFDQSFSIEAGPASREVGEEWRSPNDIRLRVNNIEFTDTYEYEDYDGATSEESASAGSQWAFIDFYAENVGNESEYIPYDRDVNIIADGQQFETAYITKEEGAYESDQIRPEISREGWIAYEIPAELTPEDIEVSYTNDVYEGEWTVRWVANLENRSDSDSGEETQSE